MANNLKPFNLEEALAGKPVVNGKGDKVVVTALAMTSKTGHSLVSQRISDGDLLAYHKVSGETLFTTSADRYRLFMAPTERKVWLNLYPDGINWILKGAQYDTEAEADKQAIKGLRIGGKAHPITIQE